MAATLIQTIVATPLSSTAISTPTFTVSGSNHTLIAYPRINTTGRTITVADTVNSGNYNQDKFANGVGLSAGIYSFPNTAQGSIVVTATQSGAAVGLSMVVEDWAGLLMPTPFDKFGGGNGTGATSNTSIATATLIEAPELAVSMLALVSAATGITVTAPFIISQSSGLVQTANYQPATTAGVSATWSWSTSQGFANYVATYRLAMSTPVQLIVTERPGFLTPQAGFGRMVRSIFLPPRPVLVRR